MTETLIKPSRLPSPLYFGPVSVSVSENRMTHPDAIYTYVHEQ